MILFNSDIFDHRIVEQMANHFKVMVMSFLQDFKKKNVWGIKIMDEAEQNLVTEGFNETAIDFPKEKCVHDLFVGQTKKSSSNICCRFKDDVLTYSDLEQRSRNLACYLLDLDLGKEQVVGLFMERSLEMYVAFFGIIRAGYAYLPLDPKHPPNRLCAIVDDSDVRLILTQTHLREHLSDMRAQESIIVRALDDKEEGQVIFSGRKTQLGSHIENALCTSDSVAYILYTSGTTGMPKGVMIRHRSVVNLIWYMQDVYALNYTDQVLQKTPFTFDAAVWECFWGACVGSRVTLAGPDGDAKEKFINNLKLVPKNPCRHTIERNVVEI